MAGYIGGMDNDVAARRLEALGNGTRLQIFRFLERAGHGGLPVSELRFADFNGV